MSRYKKDKGDWGENLAAEFLVNNGYRIVERNYRCRFGEIDIIAEKDDTIHFIEVKTRSGYDFGGPLMAITHKKMKHIIKTAQFYLITKNDFSKSISIDGIGIVGDDIDFVQGINM